jgi:hypothetical protein
MNKDFTPTRQQAFDMSAKHLLSTGKPSVLETGYNGCCYSGSGCAMRPFLGNDPEELAKLDKQGGLYSVNLTLLPEYVVQDIEFYSLIQNCHDHAAVSYAALPNDIDEWAVGWKEAMFKLADRYNLNTEVFVT